MLKLSTAPWRPQGYKTVSEPDAFMKTHQQMELVTRQRYHYYEDKITHLLVVSYFDVDPLFNFLVFIFIILDLSKVQTISCKQNVKSPHFTCMVTLVPTCT